MKKFEKSINNFKEIGKDVKAVFAGTLSFFKDVIMIPVKFVEDLKDVRDEYLASKQSKETVVINAEVVQE